MGDAAQVGIGTFYVRLPCEPVSVPRARGQLREWCQRIGINSDLSGIQLAVTEAMTNAVRHAGSDFFEVKARCTDESLIVSLSDAGPLRREPAPGQSLGLGIAIIRELADCVCFEHTDPGTRVTMRFDRHPDGGACEPQR